MTAPGPRASESSEDREPVCLPVEVRPVPGWPGLSVSSEGEVYGPRGLRKAQVDKEGYRYVSARRPGRLSIGKLRVHTAVLLAWIGPRPDGHEGRHLNGQSLDNRLENLAWSSHLDNIMDKLAHGTMAQGEQNGNAVLTEAAVREMRRLYPAVDCAALGRRFGVDKSTVARAVRRETWGWME